MDNSKKISLLKATLMGVNIMIGAGLLTGPGKMASIAGNASFISWIIAGLLMAPTIWCIARLSGLVDQGGGLATYCRMGFGENVGFFAGWLYYICYALAVSTVLAGFRDYLIGAAPGCQFFVNPNLFFPTVVGLISVLNFFPLTALSSIQSYLTLVKLSPIFLAIFLTPWFAKLPLHISTAEWQGLPASLTFSIFGFLGFEFCANMTSLMEGGAKGARKAILCSFFMVTLLCILFNFSVLQIMGSENLAIFTAPGYPKFVALAGGWLGSLGRVLEKVIPVTTCITFFNSINGILFLLITVMHAMTAAGQIRGGNFLNSLNCAGRPKYIVVLTGLMLIAILSAFPNTNVLAGICVFALNIILSLTVMSLYKLDKDRNWFNTLMIFASLLVLSGLIVYSFMINGHNMTERLWNISPVFGFMLVGLLIHRSRPAAVDVNPSQTTGGHCNIADTVNTQDNNSNS